LAVVNKPLIFIEVNIQNFGIIITTTINSLLFLLCLNDEETSMKR